MVSNLMSISMLQLIPPNLLIDDKVKGLALTIDNQIAELQQVIINTIILPRVDELDHVMLDSLAVQYDTPFYEQSLPIERKRELIKNTINWHKKKGTVSAVEEIARTICKDSEVREWFDYDGNPYMFKIETSEYIMNEKIYDELRRVVDSVKNIRSRLETINVQRKKHSCLYFSGSIHIGKTISIGGN